MAYRGEGKIDDDDLEGKRIWEVWASIMAEARLCFQGDCQVKSF